MRNIKLAFCLALLETIVISSIERTFAQSKIIPDNTLGTESSKVINNSSGLPIETIDGGAQRGINLFHSFREFNVGEGRAVYFSNPVGIENIIGRVTGSSASEILGKLGVLGNANLFLINPNGIIFGSGASLDVNGSFVATSANAIGFGNQGFFNASSPQTPSLLTIKPSALFFNQIGAGTIENRSNASAGVDGANNPVFGLRVPDGQSLLLVGGNVLNAGGLNAFGGGIELGGLASSGGIGLNLNNQNLTFPNQVARGDVSLTNGAVINVAGNSGGAIALYGKNIDISGGSSLAAGIAAGLRTPKTTAGDITLNATQAISISQSSRVTNQVSANARGHGGNINIQADSLNLTGGSQLSSRTFGEGNSGNILVDVSGAITLDGEDSDHLPSRIINQVQSPAIGNGGDISIKAQSLNLKGGSILANSTFGEGNSGNILVDVSGAITLDGKNSNDLSTAISTQVLESAVGNGGDINIKAQSLTLTRTAIIAARTFGSGNAGNVFVDVSGAVILDGKDTDFFVTGITTQAEPLVIGDGGNINIKAESLTITQGSSLSARTLGRGNAGNVSVDVKGAITIDGRNTDFATGITTEIAGPAIGNGGDINIKAESLTLIQGGALSSNTVGRGNAGNIFVDVRDAVSLDGEDRNGFPSAITTQVAPSAIGDGGDINVTAESLTLTRGSFLSTSTFGEGNAGSISVDVNGAIRLDGESSNGFPSGITTGVAESAIGDGGNINIKAESLTLTQRSQVSASTFGQGKGGNIQVETANSVNLTNDSEISVNSEGQGNAGKLGIKTGSLTLQGRSHLLADTVSSEGGNIELQLRDILLLRDNSSISTSAGQQGAGGNGGNIDINANFIAAVPSENSDITANAFEGKGGLIKITAQGIFGIEKRDNLTSLSDITAFSQENPQLDGQVVINIQNADIRKQLVSLPTNVVDVSKLISQRCSAGRVARNQPESQFIVTGRGGLPPQPGEALRVPAIAVDESAIASEKQNQFPEITPTLEANSWRFDRQGQIVLTASATSEASSFATNPRICHGN